jgi:hypothetical protein
LEEKVSKVSKVSVKPSRRTSTRDLAAELDAEDAQDDLQETKETSTVKKTIVPTPETPVTPVTPAIPRYIPTPGRPNFPHTHMVSPQAKQEEHIRRREQIQRFLRPSAAELAKEPVENRTTDRTSEGKERQTSTPAPLKPLHETPNMRRLNEVLAKSRQQQPPPVVDDTKLLVAPTSQPVQPIQPIPLVPPIQPSQRSCSQNSFLFRTVTDHGGLWGRETFKINPNQSRLYNVIDFNPDAKPPTSHCPVVVAGDCYATLKITLSWIPIKLHSQQTWIPTDAVRGSTEFTILCFPNPVENENKSKAIYTCEIPKSKVVNKVVNIKSKTSVALLDDHVAFQAQVFINKDVLRVNPTGSFPGEQLFYLDMHVAHMKHDTKRYRLLWFAHVHVLTQTLKQ